MKVHEEKLLGVIDIQTRAGVPSQVAVTESGLKIFIRPGMEQTLQEAIDSGKEVRILETVEGEKKYFDLLTARVKDATPPQTPLDGNYEEVPF